MRKLVAVVVILAVLFAGASAQGGVEDVAMNDRGGIGGN